MLRYIIRFYRECLIMGICLLMFPNSFAQNRVSLDITRNLILQEQISQAVTSYAQLVNKESKNPELLTEYAYALALGGIYDVALMNLDRARIYETLSSESYFYVAQIFSLIGYDWISNDYFSLLTVPEWVASDYPQLRQKYKQIASISRDDLEIAFKRANYLTATGMYFQSIAVYEGIMEEYPDKYILHVGYSIPLEKLGLIKRTVEELETGILLMDNDPQYDDAKQVFTQRLDQLKQKEHSTPKETPAILKQLNKYNPQTMLYAGGMFSSNYISFNSRFGVYFSNSFNGAVNLGVSGSSGSAYVNLGVSGYQRLGRVFLLGLGVNQQLAKNNNLFSINPSVGLSFINRKGNSSWDIFFNLYCPVQKGADYVYGFSVGKSFYFGNRK